MSRNTHLILFLVAIIGSRLLFIGSFTGRVRAVSPWIRYALLLFTPIGITWAATGVSFLYFQHQLTRSAYHFLYTLKLGVGGIAIGILAVLFLSSEFRALSTRKKA